MPHRRSVIVTLSTLLVAGAIDLGACGDKFLRFGRSARYDKYAAVHPASILLYVPTGAKTSDVRDFETALKRAGHRPRAVRGFEAFSAALAKECDIVIADYVDAERLKPHVVPARTHARLLPIVHDAKKQAMAEIRREYVHVLKAGATERDVLVEIDRVMKARLSNQP